MHVNLFKQLPALAAAGLLAAALATPAGAAPAAANAPAAAAAPHAAASAPNIVMLMTDDLDMSVWQNALDRGLLPRIQADIINHGTTFDNMFVALSVCCPSRTSYLTGQYPHNHGVIRNNGGHGGFQHFDNDGSALPVWLKKAGYRTGLLGKYLNGYGHTPKDMHGAYIPPGWDTWWALFGAGQYDYTLSNQGVSEHHGHDPADYQTDVLSAQAVNFLKSTDPRPFFLTLTPTAPHYEGSQDNDDDGGLVRAPDRYLDTPPLATIPPEALASYNEADMSDKPAWMRTIAPKDPVGERAGYNSKVAAMRAVDDLLGAVVDQLKASGQYANTMIIVTSDNGFQYGTHRKDQKTDLYEESIRVPMVVHSPGQTLSRHVNSWVMNVDWAPTILEVAGATGNVDLTMDGVSFVPWLGNGSGQNRKSILVEHPADNKYNADHPPYTMVRTHDPAITGDTSGKTIFVYAETLNAKNILSDVEFYDFSVDPLQDASLQKSKDPKRRAQMTALHNLLLSLKNCVGTQCQRY